jgi:hypothetical protein
MLIHQENDVCDSAHKLDEDPGSSAQQASDQVCCWWAILDLNE